jgi:hypothetical protein
MPVVINSGRCLCATVVPFRKQVITCEHTYYLLLIVSMLWQKIFSAVPRRRLTGTDVAFRALMKSTKMDLEEVGWGGHFFWGGVPLLYPQSITDYKYT